MTVQEQQPAQSEQLHNLQERPLEHEYRTPEIHHTPDQDLHQGRQPLDLVADLQDPEEEGLLFAEEINRYLKTLRY